MNWGSAAADRQRGVMVANVNQLAFWVRLIPREQFVERRLEATRLQMDAEFTSQRGTPLWYESSTDSIAERESVCPTAWGKTVAVDLNSGDIRWETPAATFSFGGVLITGGGLVFLSGAVDQKFRALDIDNGKELWSSGLPAGAQSTPMSYQLAGKQYVVIAAGGHGDLPVKLGDYLVAYALPQ